MHRIIMLSALLAVITLGGCAVAGDISPSDDSYYSQMNSRHNRVPPSGW